MHHQHLTSYKWWNFNRPATLIATMIWLSTMAATVQAQSGTLHIRVDKNNAPAPQLSHRPAGYFLDQYFNQASMKTNDIDKESSGNNLQLDEINKSSSPSSSSLLPAEVALSSLPAIALLSSSSSLLPQTTKTTTTSSNSNTLNETSLEEKSMEMSESNSGRTQKYKDKTIEKLGREQEKATTEIEREKGVNNANDAEQEGGKEKQKTKQDDKEFDVNSQNEIVGQLNENAMKKLDQIEKVKASDGAKVSV